MRYSLSTGQFRDPRQPQQGLLTTPSQCCEIGQLEGVSEPPDELPRCAVIDRPRKTEVNSPGEKREPDTRGRAEAIRLSRDGRRAESSAQRGDRIARSGVGELRPPALQSRRQSRRQTGNEESSPQPVRCAPDRKREGRLTAKKNRAIAREFLVVVAGKTSTSAYLEELLRRNGRHGSACHIARASNHQPEIGRASCRERVGVGGGEGTL